MADYSITSPSYLLVLDQIKEFKENNKETSIDISLDGLMPKERSQIYQTIETPYTDHLKFEKRSSSHGNQKKVCLSLAKTTDKSTISRNSIEVNGFVIESFHKYTKIPLPLMQSNFLDYYMDLSDPYEQCRTLFNHFLQDIQSHGSIHRLNNRINEIVTQITDHIVQHSSTIAFNNSKFEEELMFFKSSPFKSCQKVYLQENQNKLFISMDIDKANYTILNNYHPDVFGNMATWEDFVRSFCGEIPIEILIRSKHIRERIFGEARLTKKTTVLSEYFIRKALDEIKCLPTDIFLLCGDETVLGYDFDRFRSMYNRYHGRFFKVLAFRLIKLPNYNYFVKEYLNPFEVADGKQLMIIQRKFKCIPRYFLMQCIKKYENKPILEIDRKFSSESGHIATFDEALF